MCSLRKPLSFLLLFLSVALMFSAAIPSGAAGTDTEAAVTSIRRPGTQNLLIAGRDRASGLCDVIMLVSIDETKRAASVVQIPRDTYAAYTDKHYRKLNGAKSALGGMNGFRDLLAQALGVEIDHYLLLDLNAVGEIVDAIGGVTLTLPVDMDYDDNAQGLSIHLKAGEQTLDGRMAEQFIRYRSGYARADLARLDAQKLFLSAFLTKVHDELSLPQILAVVRSLYGKVSTDLSFSDALHLAATGMKLDPDALQMATLPGRAARTKGSSGAWYYILSRKDAYETVNRLLNLSDSPMPESAFDRDRLFSGKGYPHFEAIYDG